MQAISTEATGHTYSSSQVETLREKKWTIVRFWLFSKQAAIYTANLTHDNTRWIISLKFTKILSTSFSISRCWCWYDLLSISCLVVQGELSRRMSLLLHVQVSKCSTLPFRWSQVLKKVHLQLNAFCHSFGVPIPKSVIFKSSGGGFLREWPITAQKGKIGKNWL